MRVLVTGGAGYIGSLLTGLLLDRGHGVVVLDKLLFGGDSLLGVWHRPGFAFVHGDVTEEASVREAFGRDRVDAVVHLAAIVGFPACQALGRPGSWDVNVEGTRRLFEAAESAGAGRFVFSSTYSNYGLSQDGRPVTEESPLFPQSLYAETKIAAEERLRERAAKSRCAPLILRFATLYGVSPRTRFDLLVNQFVLEAVTKKELVVYQKAHSRSFVHVRDVCSAVLLALEAPVEELRGETYNVGSESGNYTKEQILTAVQLRVPGLRVYYKDTHVESDMRDVAVSFAKIRARLGFVPAIGLDEGITEVLDAIRQGVIKDPLHPRYRNADFDVQ